MARIISSSDSFTPVDINDVSLGIGLTEGYTTLLCNRYFDQNDNGYPVEKYITLELEKIIGKNNMEKYYFKADLFSLLKALETSKGKAIQRSCTKKRKYWRKLIKIELKRIRAGHMTDPWLNAAMRYWMSVDK